MGVVHRAVTRDHLEGIAHTALGTEHRLVGISRLRGGSKKGVYRLTFDDDTTVIVYSWDDAENYWVTPPADHTDPFAPACGIELFEASAMQRHQCPHFGKVALIEKGSSSEGSTCEQVVLGRALDDLTEAASRDPRITRFHEHLETVVRTLAAAVRPRSQYGLIHGELGPDHVLVDQHGQPVLIDIEGLMFFDVEWEHALLHLRFGEHYRWLGQSDLDEQRLTFHTLAMRLSLVAGPLRLLDGDFPDRALMRRIAERNLQEALAFLPITGRRPLGLDLRNDQPGSCCGRLAGTLVRQHGTVAMAGGQHRWPSQHQLSLLQALCHGTSHHRPSKLAGQALDRSAR
ncbi:hypothetical protein FrEUN1fDRAFT_3679 [Parafrankia sp. EUN1f]|nr:hypothetical protein FrEUN1fDRAFT_3679 [Parafrankia sp. EUN1f]